MLVQTKMVTLVTTMSNAYNRQHALQGRLNAFLCAHLSLPQRDYCATLTVESLLAFKTALSDINNLLTLLLALEFVEWVAPRLSLDEATRLRLRDRVLSTKPNANGFDVVAPEPINLVAEVKTTVPTRSACTQ